MAQTTILSDHSGFQKTVAPWPGGPDYRSGLRLTWDLIGGGRGTCLLDAAEVSALLRALPPDMLLAVAMPTPPALAVCTCGHAETDHRRPRPQADCRAPACACRAYAYAREWRGAFPPPAGLVPTDPGWPCRHCGRLLRQHYLQADGRSGTCYATSSSRWYAPVEDNPFLALDDPTTPGRPGWLVVEDAAPGEGR